MDKYYNQPVFYKGDYMICNKGSQNETSSYLVKYCGSSWADSDIPAYGTGEVISFIVYNNKLYAIWHTWGLFVYSDENHTWQSVCTDDIYGKLLIYNNNLYMSGYKSSDGSQVYRLYKFNFTNQTATCDVAFSYPSNVSYLDVAVINNKIYCVGSPSSVYPTNLYRLDDTTWTDCGSLPYGYSVYGDGTSLVAYNDKLHLLGSAKTETDAVKHYSYDGTSWVQETDMPYVYYLGRTIVI